MEKEKILVPIDKDLGDINKHCASAKSSIKEAIMRICDEKENLFNNQLQFVGNYYYNLNNNYNPNIRKEENLKFLQKKLKKSQKRKFISFVIDFISGNKKHLKQKIEHEKYLLKKYSKLEELKKSILKNLEDLYEDFLEIKKSINNLELKKTNIYLTEFISFNYSVYCNYKYLAKRFDDEPYQDFETHTRKVEDTKWVNRKGSAYIPGKPPSVTRSFSYKEPITSTRTEEYAVPVTNYRKVLKKEKNFGYVFDTGFEGGTSKCFALSSKFDNWKDNINNLKFEEINSSLIDYEKIIKNKYSTNSTNNLEIKQTIDDRSYESIYDAWHETQTNIYIEKFRTPILTEIEQRIKSTEWNDFDDINYKVSIEKNSHQKYFVPFIEQQFNFYSNRFGINIFINQTNLLSSLYYPKKDSINSYEYIWDKIDSKIVTNKNLLAEAKETSLSIPKPKNYRLIFVISAALLLIGVPAIILSEFKKSSTSIRCEQEITNLKVSESCKKYLFKNY